MPWLAVTAACNLGLAWLLIQARLEEANLLERLPDYRPYMADVPRFVPRLGQEKSMPREPISLAGSLRPLQEQFNAGRDRLRFIALLSPT